MKKREIGKARLWVGGVLIWAAMALFMAAHWCWRTFGRVPFDQSLFHLLVPTEGANTHVFAEFALRWLPFSLLWTGLILLLAVQWTKRRTVLHITVGKKTRTVSLLPFGLLRRHLVLSGAVLLAISMLTGAAALQLPQYVYNQSHPSSLYEDHYVDGRTAGLSFPETKRNLIYIYLESMETTYTSKERGGNRDVDLIPELSSLALENVSFSPTDQLGGALEVPGTNWTVAAMTAQTAGVPLKVPVDRNSYGNNGSAFLPGVYTLGDILEAEGYNQMLMVGSDANFGGRKAYFVQHGSYQIWDYNTAKQEGRIPQDYHVWWGYEDAKLFEYAKDQILDLAAQDAPFNFTMLTVDTHFEGGYVCALCRSDHAQKYSNVIACSSRQVGEFIGWLQEQDFYDNTTVVLSGDHNCMSKTYFASDGGYTRTTYNAFINLPGELTAPWVHWYTTEEGEDVGLIDSEALAALTHGRQFCSMDLFPTTLASLGVHIEGERLGLGTNLFSGKQTLIEEMGLSAFTEELNKVSRFYNRNLLYAGQAGGLSSGPADSQP